MMFSFPLAYGQVLKPVHIQLFLFNPAMLSHTVKEEIFVGNLIS